MALAAISVLTATACAGASAQAEPSCAGPVSTTTPTGRPTALVARTAVVNYLTAIAMHTPYAAMEKPSSAAHRCSLDRLGSWLGRFPIADISVWVTPLAHTPGSVTETATITVYLGRHGRRSSMGLGLGRRELVVEGRSGKIEAARRAPRSMYDGQLAALHHPQFLPVASGGIVIDADRHPAAARLAQRTMNVAWPVLSARYGPTESLPPAVMIVPNAGTAAAVAGFPVSGHEAGFEYAGMVVLIGPRWCCGATVKSGLVVHELTHSATRAMLEYAPTSLVEGVARYEEQEWDRAHGYSYSTPELSTAYEDGWSSLAAWRQDAESWYAGPSTAVETRYDDGAAIVRETIREAGMAGLKRLAAAFRVDADALTFTTAQLDAAFRAATGHTFAQVSARARLVAIG